MPHHHDIIKCGGRSNDRGLTTGSASQFSNTCFKFVLEEKNLVDQYDHIGYLLK